MVDARGAGLEELLGFVREFLDGGRERREWFLERVSVRALVEVLGKAALTGEETGMVVAVIRRLVLEEGRSGAVDAVVEPAELLTGLRHPSASVRKLCLECIGVMEMDREEGVSSTEAQTIPSLVRALDDEDIGVAAEAKRIILRRGVDRMVFEDPDGHAAFLDVLDGKGSSGQVGVTRAMELLVSCCSSTQSARGRELLRERLASGENSRDLLSLLAWYESVAPLAHMDGGMLALEEAGVIKGMADTIARILRENDVAVTLVAEGLLRVACHMTESRDGVESFDKTVSLKFLPLMEVASKLIEPDAEVDSSVRESAAVAIGCFAHAARFDSYTTLLSSKTYERFSLALPTTPRALMAVYLESVARLLRSIPAEQTQNALSLFESLTAAHTSASSMNHLLRLAREPVNEIRRAVISVFASIGEHPWGLSLQADTPRWTTFMCDLDDPDLEIREAKVHAAARIVIQAHAEELFGSDRFGRLMSTARKGLHPPDVPGYLQIRARPDPVVDIATMPR